VDFDYPFANLPLALGRTAAACLPSAILLQPFPQWLDVGRGGTYPRGDMPESRIDDLNPEQLRAATAGEGPVLTIAGAGTGKTKTLASRVAWLVSQGIDPGRIMLLTFTRRASDEMLRRARRTLGETGSIAPRERRLGRSNLPADHPSNLFHEVPGRERLT
jgi:UvrD/REP helicase N-terminal domain